MTTDPLRHVDRGIWLTIGAVGLIDIMAAVLGSFAIAWTPFFAFTGICAALVAAGYVLRHVRRDERLALLVMCNVQMMSFGVVSAALSYIAASAALPAWDATFMQWDARLGLDWSVWLNFMEAHPSWHLPLRAAYMSLMPQAVVIILILVTTGRLLHLRVFLVGTIMTILFAVAISALCPAAGTGLDPFFDMTKPNGFRPASWSSWPIFDGLRNGTYRHLLTSDAEGIVTFPSYHAAAGLLGIFAMWPVRYGRWIALVLNAAMIAATPVDGGHYFVDVFAGLALAALCWKAAAWTVDRAVARPATFASAVNVDAPSIVPPSVPVLPDLRQREPRRDDARSEAVRAGRNRSILAQEE